MLGFTVTVNAKVYEISTKVTQPVYFVGRRSLLDTVFRTALTKPLLSGNLTLNCDTKEHNYALQVYILCDESAEVQCGGFERRRSCTMVCVANLAAENNELQFPVIGVGPALLF